LEDLDLDWRLILKPSIENFYVRELVILILARKLPSGAFINSNMSVAFEVSVMIIVRLTFFLSAMSCHVVGSYRRFGRMCWI
jgi:hypothetical protein